MVTFHLFSIPLICIVTGWPEPLSLVLEDKDGQLMPNFDTLKKIELEERPLVPVSIVGKYRTGKSFLLNFLAGWQPEKKVPGGCLEI